MPTVVRYVRFAVKYVLYDYRRWAKKYDYQCDMTQQVAGENGDDGCLQLGSVERRDTVTLPYGIFAERLCDDAIGFVYARHRCEGDA